MLKFPHRSPRFKSVCKLLVPALLVFALSVSQLSEAYAPCALAVVALTGPHLPGLFSLLGAAAGAYAFFDFQPGLRFLASAILIFFVNTAFFDTKIYTRPAFRPAASAAMTALVQSVYLVARPLSVTIVFVLSLSAQWLCYALLSPVWARKLTPTQRQRAAAVLLLSVCIAMIPLQSSDFSAGRCLMAAALLLLLRAAGDPIHAATVGFGVGLAADLASPTPQFLCAAAFATGCAAAHSFRQKRWLAAPLFALAASAMTVLFNGDMPAIFLYEMLFGAVLFLLLPRKILPALPADELPEVLPPAILQSQLSQSAAAFRELYDSFFRGTTPAPPENPSVIFDQTAEQVCRKCVLCSTCWHQNYNATYNAFNDACPSLLRRGQALARDFPLHFTSRCVHLQDFLLTLNGELRSFLLRRQYYQRLLDARRQAQEQYARLGELLSGTAAVEAIATPPLGYHIGSTLQPKEGCRICGDQLAVFEVGSTLYLLLSDGMGSGEAAHREAAMTVRLLQQFLSAGIDPVPALKTLNAAWQLRSEEGGGFTTIDLLALQRQNGNATLYKYGAAPSYLKRSGSVTRFTAASLPAGLHKGDAEPECSRFSLPGGSFFVMVSDGIADETEDEWLQNLLAGWTGTDADALTGLILSECRNRRGLQDDCAILVLHLSPPGEGQKTPV